MELSVCKEDIKILKYIGDLKKELNIDKAMNLYVMNMIIKMEKT